MDFLHSTTWWVGLFLPAFLIVAYLHLAGYLGALAGLIAAIVSEAMPGSKQKIDAENCERNKADLGTCD